MEKKKTIEMLQKALKQLQHSEEDGESQSHVTISFNHHQDQIMTDDGGGESTPVLNLLSQALSSQHEYSKLKSHYEALQRQQRNLLGEDLGPLNIKDLDNLERQLDASLKQIRSTRTQAELDQRTDLQRREHMLNEENKILKQRLMEGNEINLQWNPNAHEMVCGRPTTQAHSDALFHPLECESTLQIGYQNDQITAGAGPV